MNDVLRLALVINTNHSKFTDNLSNVIIYILSEGADNGITALEIHDEIKSKIGLIFTEKEIKNSIRIAQKKNLINEISKDKYIIGEAGYKKIHNDNGKEFDKILINYAKEYKIQDHNESQIFDLICEFLYKKINENIEILIPLIGKTDKTTLLRNIYINDNDDYSDEQKIIINNFLDWDNDEKNKLLFNLISFSVDYCRLTVKRDNRSYKNYFKGKIFYLDTNIIYRLMGINNENRKKTISEFLKRCSEVGIDIVYTNYTKKEVLDSLSYHVKKLRNALSSIKASPDKLAKLFKHECDNDLYLIYYKWAKENYTFGDMEGFESNLKNEFYNCVSSFKIENFNDQSILSKEIYERYVDSFAKYKNYSKDEKKYVTIQTDIQNLIGIHKKRLRNSDGTSWNIKEYMISADHYFVEWAGKIFSGQAPYIVLPSVWYSMILKLDGRTDNDYKSFVEFMKIKYNQGEVSNVHEIIYNISKVTSEAVLQDKIIDELIDGNAKNLNLDDCEDIPSIVQQALDCVLEKTKNEGYDEGITTGLKIGMQEGYEKGKTESQEDILKKGERIGEIKGKIDYIMQDIKKSAKRKRTRNIVITIVESILVLIIMFFICVYAWRYLPDDKVERFGILLTILGFAFSFFGLLFTTIWLPVKLEKIEEKETKKRKPEIEELENKIGII